MKENEQFEKLKIEVFKIIYSYDVRNKVNGNLYSITYDHYCYVLKKLGLTDEYELWVAREMQKEDAFYEMLYLQKEVIEKNLPTDEQFKYYYKGYCDFLEKYHISDELYKEILKRNEIRKINDLKKWT